MVGGQYLVNMLFELAGENTSEVEGLDAGRGCEWYRYCLRRGG